MKKSRMNWTVKRFMKEQKTGAVQFTYPIQRAGEQWDKMQKSLLIHSIICDYPVPPLYTITEESETDKTKTVFQVLDGKQRLTNIRDFLSGEYYLDEDTPSAYIDGKKEILAGMTFQELSEDAKDAIQDFTLDLYKIEEATDDEIEDMFYRLNNGTPLSKQQKAKAKMGSEWANKIQELVNHNLVKEKASFTKLQIRKADHETALLQTMMLIDPNHELKNISSNEVFEYTKTFKGDEKNKEAIIKKLVGVMDYLDNAFEAKESMLLKKVHFPMTVLTAMMAKEKGVDPYKFSDWRVNFKDSLKASRDPEKFESLLEDTIATDYASFGGAGSVKKDKTLGRVESMQRHLNEYLSKNKNNAPSKVEEPKKEAKKPEAKKEQPKKEEPKKQEQAKKPESKDVKPATKPATTEKKDSKVEQVKKNEADKKSAGTTA